MCWQPSTVTSAAFCRKFLYSEKSVLVGDDMRKGHSFEFWSGRIAAGLLLVGIMLWSAPAVAQQPLNPSPSSQPDSLTDAVRALSDQVRQLQQSVADMRSDSERARAETRQLRHEVEELRAGTHERGALVMEAVARTENTTAASPAAISQQNDQEDQQKSSRTASLDEQYELLSGKVDDQYQTKVESASKYRMRVSGIVLTNLFANQGTVDNIDLPTLAYARPANYTSGNFGATLRQSEIGFEVFGPRVAGAKTRADLQLDLAGGFPTTPNGVNSGLMRLRTATMRMDWDNTSVVVGQDGIFFSPGAPTSFATLATPALSYAGNLWSWVPQVRIEHKIALSDASSFLFQAGILDPGSGEAPTTGYYRQPTAGEASRQPAFGTRIAWTHDVFGQPLRIGFGGYYSRQNYGFSRTVDAWAGMSDLELTLSHQFTLSGKFYRGEGLGGLYGGIGRSVLFSGDPTKPYTQVRGLNTVGGWTQLKYRPAPKLEFNAAFGMDNPYASDLEFFRYAQSYGDASLSKNRSGFANFIYRPRSDVLFSAEYRRIITNTITNGAESAGHLNLMMGVLF
jgi:regulator of replication initiation timing